MAKWRKASAIPCDTAILAVIETNHGPDYYLAYVDIDGSLVDIEYEQTIGWEIEDIDKWVPLSEIMEIKMAHWRKNDVIPDEEDCPILAVVETVGGTQYYLANLDANLTLIDLQYGDDYGWAMDNVDIWVPLSEVLEMLDSNSEG